MTLTATVSPQSTLDVITVELHGFLDLATATTVRGVLLKTLAQGPDAVIVDVSDLRVESRSRLAVFPAAVRVQGYPPTALLLCGATEGLSELMQGGILGGLPTYRDRDSALSAITDVNVPAIRRLTLRLAATTGAAAAARGLVATTCQAWGLDELRGPASLIISELVSNAVQHVGTDVTVRIARRNSYLHLSVHDYSPVLPRSPNDEGGGEGGATVRGRGLHLVGSYATAWGSNAAGDGKIVWATLRLPAPAG